MKLLKLYKFHEKLFKLYKQSLGYHGLNYGRYEPPFSREECTKAWKEKYLRPKKSLSYV